MKRILPAAAAALAAWVGLGGSAEAQTVVVADDPVVVTGDAPYEATRLRAPRNAAEVSVDTGYTQGIGIGTDRDVGAGPGVGFGLGLGWRAAPEVSLGWRGQYSEFSRDDEIETVSGGGDGNGGGFRAVTTSIEGALHLMPFERVDPVITAGAGYRMLWNHPDGPANDVFTHGIQIVKLEVGVDIRVNDMFAIGPTIGGDLTAFVVRDVEGQGDAETIDDPIVDTFFYAGLRGRFDFLGVREDVTGTVVGRR